MTPLLSSESLVSRMRERYATKRFDATRQIEPATWADLEQTLILTPSSFGLQPWKFLVVKNAAVREKLVAHSWGQRQVADASHLVVMAVQTSINEAYIDAYILSICQTRGITPDKLAGYRDMMVGSVVQGMTAAQQKDCAIKQAYIALGNFMTSAALLGIDTCPMEGFLRDKYDELLGLTSRGLTTAVLCPAGYRHPEDNYAFLPKVRASLAEMVEVV